MSLRQFFLALGLLLLIGIWGACVDVPSAPTNTTLNIRSLVRFVQAMPSAAAGDIKVDGSAITNLGFAVPSGYTDIAAGSRSVAFGSGTPAPVSLGSEQQSTVVVYNDGSATPAYLNLPEGHKDKNNGKATVAKVKFVNVAYNSGTITFHADSATGAALQSGVGFASRPGYNEITPGTHSVYAIADSGSPRFQSVIAAVSFEAGKMYTIIAAGSGATFQAFKLDDREAAVAPTGKPAHDKRASDKSND